MCTDRVQIEITTFYDLRSNRDIVLAAVRQRGDALQYASDEMKADREIVYEVDTLLTRKKSAPR